MTDTIENPSADQLEAGGKVSGTYYGLPFTDQELRAGVAGALYIGKGCWINSGAGHGARELRDVTVTSYTPPEPKPEPPWWETCDDSTLIEAWYGGTREIRRASWWRNHAVNLDFTYRHPRRVLVTDADTEVIVPKAALNDLRRRHSSNLGTDRAAVRLFLAAVDERGD